MRWTMKRFFDIFAADGYKLGKMKSIYIGIAVMAILIFVSALAIGSLAALAADSDIISSYDPETGETIDIPEETVNEIRTDYGVALLTGAPSSASALLLVAIIAALFIGTEYSSGMMRLYVGRGAGKVRSYFSKFLWMFIVNVVYVCFAFLFCAIAAAALGVTGELFASHASDAAKSFGSYIFYSLVFAAIYTSILHLLRSKAGGMATLLAMYIVIGAVVVAVVQLALGATAVIAGNATTSENIVYLYLNPYHAYDSLGNVAHCTAKELGLIFGGGMMWGAVFFAGGLLYSTKTDVK